jgi:hypothetical protein
MIDMTRQQITGELFDYDWKKQRYSYTGRALGSFFAGLPESQRID